MAGFLNFTGSAAMVLLVGCMVYCCLAALGRLPQRWPRPAQPQGGAVPCPWRTALVWAVAALGIQWLVVFLAHLCLTGSAAGFFPHLWERFTTAGDNPHYIYLAQHGYAADGEHAKLIAFYPLYPLLMRLLRPLFGGSAALAGMVLSQLCFAGAAAVMRRYTSLLLPQRGARAATLSLLLYPFAFFAFGVYTEGLFLLLAIGCLYLLHTRQWGGAGVLAFLAALCRTQGLALFFAAAYALAAAPGPLKTKLRRGALPLLGAPAGFAVYLSLNWALFGDFTLFLSYQAAAPWYQKAAWFGDNLAQQWGMAVAYPGLARFIYIPQLLLYFVAVAALLFLLLRGGLNTPAVYSIAFFGMSYLSSWLISGSRYMFGCLGLFLAVGALQARWPRRLVLITQAALLLLYAYYYLQGQSIM